MRRTVAFASAAAIGWLLTATPGVHAAASAPRLAVLIVIDQMRADYFDLFRSRFHDGFKRLVDSGAIFTEARYPYASTKTAEGHALMLSGWSPSASGIIGDSWFDRVTKTTIVAGASADHRLIDSPGEGGSPDQLLVHTLGDTLKELQPRAIVLAASWKRYAAVLNGGHHADAAYWFDTATGHMVTSDYYLQNYPDWVKRFDANDLTAPFFGREWLTHRMGSGEAPDEPYRTAFRATPFANDVLLAFAKTMIEQSGVGADDIPDLMAVSFSALDYVGHQYGPETPEFDATIDALDVQVGELLRALDARVGAGNYTAVLTADHGAPFTPEKERSRGHDAGRLDPAAFINGVQKTVMEKLGLSVPVIAAFDPPELYLNYTLPAARGTSPAAVDRAVVQAIQAQPGIARAYTAEEIRAASSAADPLLQAVAAGYYPSRSGDIHVLMKPNYIFLGGTGTTHGTPYDYDAHVPLIWIGAGIKPGVYRDHVRINDLAPTLGALIGVPYKGDRDGRVLAEGLQHD